MERQIPEAVVVVLEEPAILALLGVILVVLALSSFATLAHKKALAAL